MPPYHDIYRGELFTSFALFMLAAITEASCPVTETPFPEMATIYLLNNAVKLPTAGYVPGSYDAILPYLRGNRCRWPPASLPPAALE